MTIKASASGEVDRLIARLRSERDTDCEAAIARLRVIGSRAGERLSRIILTGSEPPLVRVAALRAADAGQPELLSAVLAAAADADEAVAIAAINALQPSLTGAQGTVTLDTISTIALDVQRPAAVRLAALDALSVLPRDLIQPLRQQARLGPAEVVPHGSSPSGASDALLDDPLTAREWLAAQTRAPLSALHDFIVHAREQERQGVARRKQDWLVTRAAAHVLLAKRGSRVALYDLREAFDAAQAPLPLDFLVAVAEVGDHSCLEPMARAWTAAPAREKWWKERLAGTAADIMHRTRLSGRSAVVKRIRAKYPGFM